MRIKVIEARQLEGNDINPVIRVTVGNKKRQTRVRQSTNRPYFNQVSQKLYTIVIIFHAKSSYIGGPQCNLCGIEISLNLEKV